MRKEQKMMDRLGYDVRTRGSDAEGEGGGDQRRGYM